MQRSIATVSPSGTLPEKLEAIAAAGFDGVEIFENDLLHYDGSPRDVRRLCADLGLEILLFQPFRDFEGCRRERLGRNLERAERKFDLMQELGTDLVLVCSNVAADALGEPALLADDLRQLAERRHPRPAHRLRGAGLGAPGEHLGAGLGPGAAGRPGEPRADPRQLPHPLAGRRSPRHRRSSGEKIFFVQMADAPLLAMDVLEWSRHFRCFPGQGGFDLAGFLAPVVASGYRGPLSLEVFNDGFRAAPTRANAVDGLRSLLYLEEKTREHLQRQTPHVAVDELLAPPPASLCDGIEFLEFAVDETLGARLGQWLQRLASPGRRAPFEECQPVAPGRHQPGTERRAPFLRPRFFRGPRTVLVPPSCACVTPARRWSALVRTEASRTADRSAPTSGKSRRCAPSTAACCIWSSGTPRAAASTTATS